jgi:hypothetical protein
MRILQRSLINDSFPRVAVFTNVEFEKIITDFDRELAPLTLYLHGAIVNHQPEWQFDGEDYVQERCSPIDAIADVCFH